MMVTKRLHDFGIREGLALLIASVSVAYAVATAPYRGIDIDAFQLAGRNWRAGIYQIGKEPAGEYPPFTIVLFSTLTLIPPEYLRVIWLGLNLAATVLIFYLLSKWLNNDGSPKARFYLIMLFLSWAPYRVTLRNGQLSLLLTALILAMEFAQQRHRDYVGGIMLGLSLCKYSLTYPFFLYALFKRRWKTVAMALFIPVVITQLFSLRMQQSLAGTIIEYARSVIRTYLSSHSAYIGNSEIKPLLFGLTGGNETLTSILSVGLSLTALIAMGVIFSRTPQRRHLHLAVLTLFGLWSVYHRVHDSVLCIIPAAVLIDFVAQKKYVRLSISCLAGLALLVLSIPGLLTERLKLSESQLSGSALGFLGLHIERLVIFGTFWALLVLLWKEGPQTVDLAASSTERI
jgi:glycosyl transferase family 87